jgi:hypothetical protein
MVLAMSRAASVATAGPRLALADLATMTPSLILRQAD